MYAWTSCEEDRGGRCREEEESVLAVSEVDKREEEEEEDRFLKEGEWKACLLADEWREGCRDRWREGLCVSCSFQGEGLLFPPIISEDRDVLDSVCVLWGCSEDKERR